MAERAEAALTVLHLSTERGLRGGEHQILLLVRGLAARGVTQALAAPAGSPLAERAAALHVELVALRPRPVLRPANLVRLVRWLRLHPGAVVHAHTSPGLSLAALARSLAPIGSLVHTRRVAFPLRRTRKYRTAADHYVAISHAIGDTLVAAGLDPTRLSVVPCSVDLDAVDAARPNPALARQAGRPLVACVAALTPEKGHATLLEAWGEVVRELPGARLVLLGDGPERDRVEQMAAAQPPGSVLLAGYRDDVPAWLKACDLYVQPSLAEGLGSALLEATSCRLAAVASRVGGLPEAVVEGETGLLVPPGEPPALAAALLALLRDPARAAAFGAAGRARVEARFSAAAMVEGYVAVYRQLVGSSSGPGR